MLNTLSSEVCEIASEQKNFQVFVRVRPMQRDEVQSSVSRKFLSNGTASVEGLIRIDEENNLIFLNDPEYRSIDKKEKVYPFDGVLSENSHN